MVKLLVNGLSVKAPSLSIKTFGSFRGFALNVIGSSAALQLINVSC